MAVAGRRGFDVGAGANHFRDLSSTYFFDRCLGWDGLCVEPQRQYHDGLRDGRSCGLVPMCLTRRKTDMMLGGMPKHRGGGMFVKPIPESGIVPENWERVSCAPLDAILDGRLHVDLFVLDVERAETAVLEAIDWGRITFGALLIETGKIRDLQQLDDEMSNRGYPKLYQLRIDGVCTQGVQSAIKQSNRGLGTKRC